MRKRWHLHRVRKNNCWAMANAIRKYRSTHRIIGKKAAKRRSNVLAVNPMFLKTVARR